MVDLTLSDDDESEYEEDDEEQTDSQQNLLDPLSREIKKKKSILRVSVVC